jgi:hypothetical protein
MDRQGIFVLVAAVSVANGILSPFIAIVFALSPIWMPELLPHTPGILAYLSSIILATATLLVSGVPAALFERLAGSEPDDNLPMYIWLGTAITMSIPAIERLTG